MNCPRSRNTGDHPKPAQSMGVFVALVGATLVGPDSPVVAAYGGGQVNFNNSGTITGRIAFQSNGTAE